MGFKFVKPRTPVVLQERRTECFLACLAMISGFHRTGATLRELRKIRPRLTRGGTLRDMLETAKEIGLQPRAVKAPLSSITSLRLPCVLHWSFDHFVVLEKISNDTFFVIDPAQGRVSFGRDDFSDHYTGIAVEFSRNIEEYTPASENTDDERPSSFIGIAAFRRPILKLAIISFFVLAFSLVTPLAIQIIIDEVIVTSDHDLLMIVCGFFLFAHITAAVSTYFQQMHILRATAISREAITFDYLSRLLDHKYSYFSERGLGTFVAQYSSLQRVVSTYVSSIGVFATSVALAVATAFFLFLIDFRIAAIILAVSVLVIVIRVLAIGYARRLESETITKSAGEEAYFVETMRGITSVSANQLEQVRLNFGIDRTAKSINANYRAGRFTVRFVLFNQILKSIEIILVIYLLTVSVIRGDMTIGIMYVFFTYRQFMDTQLASAVSGLGDILNLRVHIERINDVMSSRISRKFGIVDFLRLKGDVAFCAVSYTIDGGKTVVISDFTAEAEAGDFVAVVGPTGAGKTTLLRIALNMADPDSGHMEYDGVRLDANTMPVLRNSVGVVLQEDTLFSGNIAENISRFSDMPDYDRIAECCRLACIEEEVQQMPMGLLTEVGDLGSHMSTGQQQRLLIARALYSNPQILVFDEATANLNSEIEDEILSNILALKKTVLFASHSASVVRLADKVWRLGESGDNISDKEEAE